jgi:hypothetical protein
MSAGKDISLEEIDRWLASTSDEAADLACRAYILSRGAHVGGELPKFNRTNWHDLRKDYRDFLVFLVRYALERR